MPAEKKENKTKTLKMVDKNLLEDANVISEIFNNNFSDISLDLVKKLTKSVVSIAVMSTYWSDNIRGESTEYPTATSATLKIKEYMAQFEGVWADIEKSEDFDRAEFFSDIEFAIRHLDKEKGSLAKISALTENEIEGKDDLMSTLRKAGVAADYLVSDIKEVHVAHWAAHKKNQRPFNT